MSADKIQMFFRIIGGPHDGSVMEFNGEGLKDAVIEKMKSIRVQDHDYRIVSFDKTKMEGVAQY